MLGPYVVTQQFSITNRKIHPGCLAGGSSLASQGLGQLLEPLLQLQRKLLVTLFTDRLHVKLNKLVLESEFCVAGGA